MTVDRDDDLSREDLAELERRAFAEELHTALPGRVESYDAATQTADVRPMVRRALPNVEGTTTPEDMPIVRSVPVVWPRVGSWFLHMPLEAGDSVLLVCLERDAARWRQTGDVSDPIDHRQHHLAHAVAVPGLFPRAAALSGLPAGKLAIGKSGGLTMTIGDTTIDLGAASQFVALANLVNARLDTIQAAFDAHVHPVPAPVSANTTAPTVPIGTLASVAAQKTRAE
jgi:hypothetical protein